MHKFLMTSVFGFMLALGSSVLSPSWGGVVTPNGSMMPCDKVIIDNKPCSTDADGVKLPVPTEKNTIIIPKDISAENLSVQRKRPGPDTREQPATPQAY